MKEIYLFLTEPVVLVLDLIALYSGIEQQFVYVDVLVVALNKPDITRNNPAVVERGIT